MTDLDRITKDVSPTSLKEPIKEDSRSVEMICGDLIEQYKFSVEETNKFNNGISIEKLNRTILLKMMHEIIVDIIDSSKKQHIGDKIDEALFLQNKKIVKDITFSLFSILNNYSYNDKHYKIFLLGKLIQSLHGSR